MKPLALILLILGCVLVLVIGLVSLFIFAMSLGPSGTANVGWGDRLLILLPIILLAPALFLAFIAFMAGNYSRSAKIGSVFAITLVGGLIFLSIEASKSARYVRELQQQELEYAQYPVQKFIRPTETGADTLIVFPSRVVAYRIFDPNRPFPLSGPLGELNKTRDTIQIDRRSEGDLKRGEFESFVNSAGEKFAEVFQFQD